jgi:hypothetical protein
MGSIQTSLYERRCKDLEGKRLAVLRWFVNEQSRSSGTHAQRAREVAANADAARRDRACDDSAAAELSILVRFVAALRASSHASLETLDRFLLRLSNDAADLERMQGDAVVFVRHDVGDTMVFHSGPCGSHPNPMTEMFESEARAKGLRRCRRCDQWRGAWS